MTATNNMKTHIAYMADRHPLGEGEGTPEMETDRDGISGTSSVRHAATN